MRRAVEKERGTHLGLSLGSSDRVRRRVDFLQFLERPADRFNAEEAGEVESTFRVSCGQNSRSDQTSVGANLLPNYRLDQVPADKDKDIIVLDADTRTKPLVSKRP